MEVRLSKAQAFVELERRHRDLKRELDDVTSKKAEIEQALLEEFSAAGVSNMSINGYTLYLHSQVWAGAQDGDKDRACQALKKAGLPEYVQETFNHNSLSAYVRELIKQERENLGDEPEPEDLCKLLPEELQDALSVTEKHSLRARKSRK